MNEFIEKKNYREKKITSAEIIVTGTKDKPYFEIKYKEVGKEDYSIGYSSYDLNNVFDWKEDCFEIVNELAEEYKLSMTNGGCVDCDECEHRSEDCLCDISENEEECPLVRNNGWIPCDERLPETNDNVLCWYEYYRFGEYNGMYQTYGIGNYYKSMDFWGGEVSNGHKCKVIAWKTLPAPYNPKGE